MYFLKCHNVMSPVPFHLLSDNHFAQSIVSYGVKFHPKTFMFEIKWWLAWNFRQSVWTICHQWYQKRYQQVGMGWVPRSQVKVIKLEFLLKCDSYQFFFLLQLSFKIWYDRCNSTFRLRWLVWPSNTKKSYTEGAAQSVGCVSWVPWDGRWL